MQYDIFFSISHPPGDGHTPTERKMFENFFAQVRAADAQGYGTAWVAQTHLSTQVQKENRNPVVPHYEGEIGLNNDIFQLAHKIFAQTENIHVGSAVMNIICNGGPIAAADRIASFCSLHGMDPNERRKLHIGFSAGRFQFMNEAYGVVPRDDVEQAAWPALRGQVFAEACEIFLRLVRGDTLSSDDIAPTTLTRANFRSDEDWARVKQAAAAVGRDGDAITIPNRWIFEKLKIVPQDWRRDVVDFMIGSHDPRVQDAVNRILPVKVANLSITAADKIDATHQRMAERFHADGGPWKRSYMPRTLMVFINDEPGLTEDEQRAQAHKEARKALGMYWKALTGTIDPNKIEAAANNAVIGTANDIADQLIERFHPDDRLMLWFDFYNHDCDRVIRNQQSFMDKVAPKVASRLT